MRGPVPGLSIRANGSSLPLVLIKRIAHVRGPVPGLSIRANGSSLPLVLIERIAHVRAGGRAVASVKFFVVRPQDVLAFFFKKGATLPLTL